MLIGLMSDTHDSIANIEKAVGLFNSRGVEMALHMGDFTSPFSFIPLNGLEAEFVGIFGNNDGDLLMLSERSNRRIHKQPHFLTLKDKKLVMVHEHFLIDALVDSGHYDVVLYGHTHKPIIERRGRTLLINPGETGSQLYGKATVGLLDLDKMDCEIVGL